MSLKSIYFVLFAFSFIIFSCKKEEPYDADKQLMVDEQLIKDFLALKKIDNAVRDTSTGVYYIITEPGTGDISYYTNTLIKAKYTGRLLNGEVFDSGTTGLIAINRFIYGWQIGIPKIQKGGKIRLFIPSLYAYGPNSQNGIPANSILDFDIELLDVVD